MDILVRSLREDELAEAERIHRLAFGTRMRLADPMTFRSDTDYIRTRWRVDPSAVFAAEVDGGLAGSAFAAHWGSLGIVGPLSVRPDLWDRGIATALMEPVMAAFEQWRVDHIGLFTSAESPKHLGLYQKFGFWPRYITAIMTRPVGKPKVAQRWTVFSQSDEGQRTSLLEACRKLAISLYPGLDLSREIRAVADQGLGDTVLLWDDSKLAAFGVCHTGPGTEAGSGACYIKFGAVRPGGGGELFHQLLNVCEEFAASQGASRLVAGANMERHWATRRMLKNGFRMQALGLAMCRPNQPYYNQPDAYIIDDWR